MANLVTKGFYKVPYWENGDGYRETYTRGNVEMVRTVRCNWSERKKFISDMMGESLWDGTSATLTRYSPEQHPLFPKFYAVSMSLRQVLGVQDQKSVDDDSLYFRRRDDYGDLVGDETTDYDGYAVYDVTYRPVEWYVVDDKDRTHELQRNVIREIKFATDYLPIPGMMLQWTQAPIQPIAEPVGKIMCTANAIYRWIDVPTLQVSRIFGYLGKVNSASFDTVTYGSNWAAGTVLFQNVEARRERHANGYIYWQISYGFTYRPSGWNALFRRQRGSPLADYYDFEAVASRNPAKPAIYDTADLNDLFKMA